MAGIRLIRGRIKSANNIAKITNAMEMVAASKMKKAQEKAINNKPYADKIYQAMAQLSRLVDTRFHQLLLEENKSGKTLAIIISTNKGLCGSLNTNLFRKCLSWFSNKEEYDFITIGNKGAKFITRSGYKLVADFSQTTPFTQYVPSVIDLAINGFLKGQYKQVIIVYSSFINALNIIPDQRVILPMKKLTLPEGELILPAEFLIEPNAQELLNTLIPHYLETQVQAAIIQAEASEHSARMLAMKSATDNALNLASELTLIYNKLRQEQITYEIADITRSQLSLSI